MDVWRGAIVVLTLAMLPSPSAARFLWFGKKPDNVERVKAQPVPGPPIVVRPEPPLSGRNTCIDVRAIGGAQVFGDASVELTMQGGARWRMYFAQGCPALNFYQGFYYRRAELGRLCAGRDAVISRSGGECAIASILPVPKAKPARKTKRKRHHRHH